MATQGAGREVELRRGRLLRVREARFPPAVLPWGSASFTSYRRSLRVIESAWGQDLRAQHPGGVLTVRVPWIFSCDPEEQLGTRNLF